MLSSSITVVIESVYIFLGVVNDRKCIKILKLFMYLSVGAHIAVLLRGLYVYSLSLLKVPSCLIVTAFYKIFIEFPFRLL